LEELQLFREYLHFVPEQLVLAEEIADERRLRQASEAWPLALHVGMRALIEAQSHAFHGPALATTVV
jgi:hypothetical protein